MERFTYLFAFLFVAFALLVVGIFAPVAIAVRIVSKESIVRVPGGFNVVLTINNNKHGKKISFRTENLHKKCKQNKGVWNSKFQPD